MKKQSIKVWRQTYNLFRSVRRNAADGFSECRDIRFVIRYHCLVQYHDWDARWLLQKPATRQDFLDACQMFLLEIETLYKDGLYDHINHYLKCHHILLTLRLLARRHPLLWYLAFHLPLR